MLVILILWHCVCMFLRKFKYRDKKKEMLCNATFLLIYILDCLRVSKFLIKLSFLGELFLYGAPSHIFHCKVIFNLIVNTLQ